MDDINFDELISDPYKWYGDDIFAVSAPVKAARRLHE